MIFDTHAHYDDEAFDGDRPELLGRLKEAGVGAVMNVAASLESCRSTLKLAESYDWIYGAMGVHPSETGELDQEGLQWIKEQCGRRKIKAVGEIGLDYHYDLSPREDQRRAFRRQIRLAHTTGLPAALHVREAHDEAFAILREEGFPEAGTLLHCFDLDWETLEPWVDRGCFVALGGALTFKRCQDTRDAVARTPRNLLLTETDSPYMTPEPMRGMPCGPAHTVFTAACMAEVLGCETEKARSQMLAQIAQNARALLDRPPTAWQIEHAQTAATERNCE